MAIKTKNKLDLDIQSFTTANFKMFENDVFLKLREQYQRQIKDNPSFLTNPIFVQKSALYLDLPLKDYPDNIKHNHYFLQTYFSVKPVSPKEYQHIPSGLLEDPFFISSILRFNPDIYLLADKSVQNNDMLDELKRLHEHFFVKYATEEQLHNIDFVLLGLSASRNNYKFLPEEIKAHDKVIQKTFIDKTLHNNSSFTTFSDELFLHVPESIQQNDQKVQRILLSRSNIFPHIPKKHYSNLELCTHYILQEPSYFQYVSEEIKNNKEFVNFLMDIPRSHTTININHRPYNVTDSIRFNFDPKKIIPLLPESYFDNNFCDNNKKYIAPIFKTLPKNLRGNEFVLKHIFKTYMDDNADKITYHTDMFQTDYLNAINNEDVKDSLKSIYKSKKSSFKSPNYIGIVKEFELFLDSYFLFKKIDDSTPVKDIAHKKKKI